MPDVSLPPREAWIEILTTQRNPYGLESLPPREAWIEMPCKFISWSALSMSLPPREAWIEI